MNDGRIPDGRAIGLACRDAVRAPCGADVIGSGRLHR
jgi:hypothetical protein